ncbi:MAG TPA: DinB family protein [Nitrolancea sp.]|jgi:uncharacterized damage-inducible protein DinB|nr:DinB family protein [Nitrolancea sp.]
MTEPLHELFRYHTWATLRLLDYCATLPAELLEFTAPGVYGTIRQTLAHLITADAGYLSRVTYDVSVRIASTASLPLDTLREHFVKQSQGWQYVLDHIDRFDPTMPAREDHPDLPHALNLFLNQAIHHGNDHRAQVCSILGANGLDVPEIDGWMYWFVTRAIPLSE